MTDKELLKKFNEFLEENKTNFVNQINKEDKNLILDFIFYVVLKAERKEMIEMIEKKREELADLEHKQWSHWTSYMLKNLTPENQERWMKQIETDYKHLTEKEKDSDREWADRAIKIIKLLK